MKKFTKFSLVFGVTCAVLGIGLSTGAIAMGAQFYDIPSMTVSDYWEMDGHRVYRRSRHDDIATVEVENIAPASEVFTGVRNLDIEVAAGSVTLITGNQEEIEVYDASTDFFYQYYMDGNTLKIESPREIRWFPDHVRELTITIPENYEFHEVDIEVNAGEFVAEELVADSLDLDTGAGSVRIESGKVRKFNGDCKAGEITYVGTITSEVEADCSAGSIRLELDGEETDYNYETKVSAGSIQIGDQLYEGMRNRGSGTYNGASGMMELECKAGEIVVTFQ